MITGLNHITLAVSDLERSLHFYTELLGLKGHVAWENGAYLSVGSLWLCLSVDQIGEKNDYTHFAFSVSKSDFEDCCNKLLNSGVEQWKINKSEGDSLYFLDPDGHKLELHVGGLESRLESLRDNPYSKMRWLS
ncbi:fosfomycin resistance glutathione transferase [Leucothrix pacifica]|uniref:Fosfomycin resistance glutathione transferase n=1 Tax=Leucothrix pacifica TaxID=1247513 RepID=A0A317CRC4_9GAMM|nr:fosfomycin resistance glutathione transferase [Leucothrix pacifica]PWR00738.1 fosfomycin resistance glutathione transferase [Leucothrix pacifica]